MDRLKSCAVAVLSIIQILVKVVLMQIDLAGQVGVSSMGRDHTFVSVVHYHPLTTMSYAQQTYRFLSFTICVHQLAKMPLNAAPNLDIGPGSA
jgi:hypothetical protein